MNNCIGHRRWQDELARAATCIHADVLASAGGVSTSVGGPVLARVALLTRGTSWLQWEDRSC